MAYDEELAARVRDELAAEETLAERKMFGGLSFLLHGHMAVAGRSGGGLMVRVDPATAPGLVATTPAEPVEMRGRPMKGWLHLDTVDLASDDQLGAWVARAVAYVETLDPKR